MSIGEVPEPATQAQPSGRLFTVGIPVYNGKALLRACIESVISSTLPRERFEIVIADDGSTEPATLAILEEFEHTLAADPGFFRVVTLETNSGGAARPRNRIIEAATGAYIFFVDYDDTIGTQALERIADALTQTPADWVALHQAAVAGRASVATVSRPKVEVPRKLAMTTLTVHKVFRRAEIERQQLRFDEQLPSGQDISFAFSFLVNAQRFLMLGGYDYYYLTRHDRNPDEPAHLSRRNKTPEARVERDERILSSMLAALRNSPLPEAERREILTGIVLPRMLVSHGYLRAIVDAGPETGPGALRRLSELLADPWVGDLDPTGLEGVTAEHLAAIATADWTRLVRLTGPTATSSSVEAELSGALSLTMESLQTLRRLVAPTPAPAGDLVEVAAGRPYQLSAAFRTSSSTGVVKRRRNFFFHTAVGPGQWIRVDLGHRQRVRRIEVTNRRGGYEERARHIFAVLSESELGERRVFPMYGHGRLPDAAWEECGIDLPDVPARYVTITSPMNTALHFSDLRVYVRAAVDRRSGSIPAENLQRVLRGVQRRLRSVRQSR